MRPLLHEGCARWPCLRWGTALHLTFTTCYPHPSRAEYLINVKCYTFGAPRVGNAAWAKEYNAAVPDTWHLVNSDDAVTQVRHACTELCHAALR